MIGNDDTQYFFDESDPIVLKPCLIIIAGGALGHVYPLENPGNYIIGRSENADIVVTHQTASRRHALLQHQKDGFYLVDLETVNGTLVNDASASAATILRDGDIIRLGGAVLKFVYSESIEKAFYSEMYHLATRDPLTGLGNRRFFMDAALACIGQSMRKQTESSLVIIDIDYFKSINDKHGHVYGDTVLKSFANTLTHCLREHDIEGRIGGEEFAIFLPDTPSNIALKIAERIKDTQETESRRLFGADQGVTISAGLTTLTATTGQSLEAQISLMIERADKALYSAKSSGRNMVAYYFD